MTVRIRSPVAGAISLARRLSFSKASRFICNFIWEYFLKTCASPWRSICVTHSSGTPPALSRVAERMLHQIVALQLRSTVRSLIFGLLDLGSRGNDPDIDVLARCGLADVGQI